MTGNFNSMAAGEDRNLIDYAMKSFLAGDPLRCIAAGLDMDSYQALRLLSTRVADKAEAQRSQALGQRCAVTAKLLFEEMGRGDRLMGAGIDALDVPKVLAALGVPLDVDIAIELLRSFEILKDIHHQVNRSQLVKAPKVSSIEALSLLYIVGRHRGVEPDYRFALGKMPLPGIAAFRELQSGHLAPSQMADVIATVESTAEAVKQGNAAGITYSDYRDTVTGMMQETGSTGRSWPVPGSIIRQRLGHGSWSTAIEAVGLIPVSNPVRFNPEDYEEAAQAFLRMYTHFGSPKDVASYDSWVIAEKAAGRDRPSVVAIRRYFGAWESMIGAAMPPEVGLDEFLGMVSHLREENAVEERWARAGELASEVLANMPWNSFLSIDYGDETDGPNRPYAQANPSADGVWCEIVSEEFLSAEQWPINTDYLVRNGWSAPDEEVPNWHKQGVPLPEAGHVLLEGLAYGRDCRDPQKVRWHSGDFPGGPGPDGGLILDFASAGVDRDLRKAS